MTRILLADDHAVVRKGIRETLEEIPGVSVRGETNNAGEVLKRLAKEPFEILVMDISMPGRSGLEIISEINRRWPRVAILVYTMHPETELAVRAYKAGASGYLTKDMPLAELVQAVRQIMGGHRYVNSAVGEKLVSHLATKTHSRHQKLSARELQVMKLIADGESLKEIAQKLSLNAKTVSTYRTRILEKMRLRTNADLTRYMVERRLQF